MNTVSPATLQESTADASLAGWNDFHVVQVTSDVLGPAAALIERRRLRGFDAIHLCSALWSGKPTFACYDERLRAAAAAEGLSLAG